MELLDYREGGPTPQATIAYLSTRDGAPAVLVAHALTGRGDELNVVAGAGSIWVATEHGWRDSPAPSDKMLTFAEEMNGRDADWQLHAYGRARHASPNPGANSPKNGIACDAEADRRSWALTVLFLAELYGKAS